MEPVFMVLSQSAAVAALLAIDANTDVQHVDVKKLQQVLVNNPLADNSTVEILVDNDDNKQVSITGSWTTDKKGSYGPSMFVDDGKDGQLKTVRFTPNVVKQGHYSVYAYFPKLEGLATHTPISFFDGKKSNEIKVKESDIRVEGQTSGEWVLLGKFNLQKGTKSYVEISNKGANGKVVADALLFVPAFTN